MDSTTISLPRSILELLSKRAKDASISIEEYLLDLLSRDLDPSLMAKEYIRAAEELLE